MQHFAKGNVLKCERVHNMCVLMRVRALMRAQCDVCDIICVHKTPCRKTRNDECRHKQRRIYEVKPKENVRILPMSNYFFRIVEMAHCKKANSLPYNIRKNICIVKPKAKEGPARSLQGHASPSRGTPIPLFGPLPLPSARLVRA